MFKHFTAVCLTLCNEQCKTRVLIAGAEFAIGVPITNYDPIFTQITIHVTVYFMAFHELCSLCKQRRKWSSQVTRLKLHLVRNVSEVNHGFLKQCSSAQGLSCFKTTGMTFSKMQGKSL